MSKTRGFRKIISLIILLAVIVVTVRFVILPHLFPIKYEKVVMEYAAQYNLAPSLIYGVIYTESKFRLEATSSKQAKGLMQITDGTGQWAAEQLEIADYNSEALYHPEINIRIGCWYLKTLNNQFGSWDTAIAAYNAGSGNVSSWLKDTNYSSDGLNLDNIPFKETENYVKRVERATRIYKWLYNINI